MFIIGGQACMTTVCTDHSVYVTITDVFVKLGLSSHLYVASWGPTQVIRSGTSATRNFRSSISAGNALSLGHGLGSTIKSSRLPVGSPSPNS